MKMATVSVERTARVARAGVATTGVPTREVMANIVSRVYACVVMGSPPDRALLYLRTHLAEGRICRPLIGQSAWTIGFGSASAISVRGSGSVFADRIHPGAAADRNCANDFQNVAVGPREPHTRSLGEGSRPRYRHDVRRRGAGDAAQARRDRQGGQPRVLQVRQDRSLVEGLHRASRGVDPAAAPRRGGGPAVPHGRRRRRGRGRRPGETRVGGEEEVQPQTEVHGASSALRPTPRPTLAETPLFRSASRVAPLPPPDAR